MALLGGDWRDAVAGACQPPCPDPRPSAPVGGFGLPNSSRPMVSHVSYLFRNLNFPIDKGIRYE